MNINYMCLCVAFAKQKQCDKTKTNNDDEKHIRGFLLLCLFSFYYVIRLFITLFCAFFLLFFFVMKFSLFFFYPLFGMDFIKLQMRNTVFYELFSSWLVNVKFNVETFLYFCLVEETQQNEQKQRRAMTSIKQIHKNINAKNNFTFFEKKICG